MVDFLGDASLEIAVTNHDDRTVSILAENNGSYAAVMTMPVSNNNRPDGITAADLNGDGLDDLAVAADNLATVFINNGAGFNGPLNYVTNGLNGSEIVAADLDCDGHLDLAVTNTDSQNLSLLRNNGNGTFAAGQLFGTGVGPEEVTVAYLDSDRDLDLAVANVDSGNISVLVNHTCAALSGDFNGDGNLDCDDVDALVADIAAGSDTASFDLTGDGFVNQDDLHQWLADAGAFNLPSGNAYLVGDANLDGNVDASDFNTWNENKFTTTAAWCSGDFNADGRVDISDFNAWNANKFSSADATAMVPEPAALPMLIFAAAAVPLLRRREVTGRSLVARS